MPLGRSKSPGPRRSPTGIDSKDVAAETASDPLSAKGKISERLTKKVDSTPPTKNRSPDLIPLTAEYEQFKKKLRALVTTIKKYADTMEKMNASRDQMIQQMALISEKSPIHDELGCELDTEATEAIDRIRNPEGSAKSVSQVCTEWQKRTKTDVSSLEVLKQWSSAQAIVNAREYGKHVVQYAEEWEEAVTERVEKEQKNVRKLLGDRSHYEKKVEAMRKRDNEMQTKGKTSTAGQLEKLQRNEEKLRESFTIHESEAGRLCVLIGTVTQEGWRDLYFLAKNYMKWESNRVGRESDIFSEIPKTLDSMKAKTAIGSKKKGKKKDTNNA